MTKRQNKLRDRRVVPAGSVTDADLQALAARLRYEGIATHKLHPGDYGFIPPVNPRPTKSPCDELRPLLRAAAARLFRQGLLAGMVSPFVADGTPKYVWAVDEDGEVYEANTKPPDTTYHGYRLGDDEREMRRYILGEWSKRCP
jgi:hypothetical protein